MVQRIPTYIQALLWPDNARWNRGKPVGTATTLTYSFMQTLPAAYKPDSEGVWLDGGDQVHNFQPFSSFQRSIVRQILKLYSDVSGLRFVEDISGNGAIKFGTAAIIKLSEDEDDVLGWANPPTTDPADAGIVGHVWLNNALSENAFPWIGSNAFGTLIHETGHALGFKHLFDDFDEGLATLLDRQDTNQYTVMSYDYYAPYEDSAPGTNSLMLYDIAAIQYLYGVNYKTRAGDTTYSWKTNQAFLETIWDAGGNDTISASNQNRNTTINLNAGQFSSIGANAGTDPKDNVAIAFGVMIENATGGSGDDELIGNSEQNLLVGNSGYDQLWGWGGQDTLTGGKGNDQLIGGADADSLTGQEGNDLLVGGRGKDTLIGGRGADRFVFDHLRERGDKIQDFSHQKDKIEVSAAEFGGRLKRGKLLKPQFVLGSKAEDRSDRFLYDQGRLFFDADGTGHSKKLLLATLLDAPSLSYRNITVTA